MKKKKKIVKFGSAFKLIAGFVVFFAMIFVLSVWPKFSKAQEATFKNVDVKVESTQILAGGSVVSRDQASLHFLTGGKLVYLPFKEGDSVSSGQTIAQLDTYALQRQLTSALNTFRSTRDTFDQTQDNSQTGVLQGAQKFVLDTQNKSGIGGQGEINIINDMAKRILDQNQANLDNSVINVELSNYALQLSTLASPINGVVFHQDVSEPNVNVTPATSFVVADPNNLVFQAQIPGSDIDFVQVGANATIKLDNASGDSISGTVSKIYPEKIAGATGSVYKVEIQSPALSSLAKLGAGGSVVVESKLNSPVILVPSWTVLNNHFIWVLANGKPKFKQVSVGDKHGQMIEILSGIAQDTKVIVDPKSTIEGLYQIL